jgi:hypothetical protein
LTGFVGVDLIDITLDGSDDPILAVLVGVERLALHGTIWHGSLKHFVAFFVGDAVNAIQLRGKTDPRDSPQLVGDIPVVGGKTREKTIGFSSVSIQDPPSGDVLEYENAELHVDHHPLLAVVCQHMGSIHLCLVGSIVFELGANEAPSGSLHDRIDLTLDASNYELLRFIERYVPHSTWIFSRALIYI